MPNVITHGLLANQAIKSISDGDLLTAIKAYPQAYLLGSNGPDLLFYYNVWPWLDQKEAKRVADLGEMMHKERINQTFDAMVTLIHKQTDITSKQIMIATVAGYVTHWSLDSVAHPFVFYRSGEMIGDNKYYHYRYESQLDSYMVKTIYQEPLSKHASASYMHVSKKEANVIAFLFEQVSKHVYQQTLTKDEVLTCIKHANQVLKVLFDPYTLWFDLVRLIEKVLYKNVWVFSSHMVIGRLDQYDVLNKNFQGWCNPTDPGMISHESFMSLFDQAHHRAVATLSHLESCLLDSNNSMATVIDDRSFDTGCNNQAKMIVFDNIYQQDIPYID